MADTNILFTFFWGHSALPRIMSSQDIELYSPEFALEEIKKHSAEIRRKTMLSEAEFNSKRRELAILVEFVPFGEYQEFFKKLKNIPDKDDIDFLALALKLNCPLWSNDSQLKNQNLLKVISTKELLEEL